MVCECNLLIVDDVEDNLYLLEDVLEDEFESMHVFSATSGMEALEILDKQRIDLAILDVQMPQMNGFELCKKMKAMDTTRDIPVIFLTAAYKSKEFIQNGFKNGAVDYIIKPFDIEQLVNRLTLYLKVIKQQEELKTLNLELEAKVEEKTSQLKELNNQLAQKVKEELSKNREKDRLIHQQSKLAIMGEMTRMIAHQWRQPLTSLLSIIQSIEFKDRLGKLEKGYIQESSKKAKEITYKMSSIIDDFQSFFKPDKQKTEFSIEKNIKKALAMLEQELLSENIDIYFETNIDGIKILSYKNEFTQVILNIIKNSIDALSINSNKERKIVVSIKLSPNNINIFIEDNAGGINEDIIDKIYDPYFSTKSKNGNGLGLFMSKIIVEEHLGGIISVTNSVYGAVFNICFPINIMSTNS
jgi:C4-dicarboxylate-specific signal transduction histidine kinase